ncbi:hypothetical protein [Marinomonas sp. THO17]|uniref:hypothetical protein n=1 Tax=Marinomonas sp. THO17 TaxID=3149048 RepID=UPI00336BD4E8
MIKSFIPIIVLVLLSGCTSHLVIEKGESIQADNCVYKNDKSGVLSVACDDVSVTLKTLYSLVDKEQTGVPFQFKNVHRELALEVTVESTNSLPLLINGRAMTIDQPLRLLSPIFLSSESSTQTIKAHSIIEQQVKKTFLIKVTEELPVTLNGLKVSSGDKQYDFDGIRILPTSTCYLMSCGTY